MSAFIFVLLFAACGQQHDAEVLIKEFMNANLKSPTALSAIEFHKMDSTSRIGDSVIANIRKFTESANGQYRTGIAYPAGGNDGKKIKLVRVEYKLDGKAYSDTYYLNNDVTRIIAVKTN